MEFKEFFAWPGAKFELQDTGALTMREAVIGGSRFVGFDELGFILVVADKVAVMGNDDGVRGLKREAFELINWDHVALPV
jgi:hypothetical protein